MTTQRWLVLLLSGWFAGLFFDLRYEHTEALEDHWTAWIPIFYSGMAGLTGLTAFAIWGPQTKRLFFWICACGLVVGGLGFWFHGDDRLSKNFVEIVQSWKGKIKHSERPPTMAPLTFVAIGMVGMLTSRRKG